MVSRFCVALLVTASALTGCSSINDEFGRPCTASGYGPSASSGFTGMPSASQVDGAYAILVADPLFARITKGRQPTHGLGSPIVDCWSQRLIGIAVTVHLGTAITPFREHLPAGDFDRKHEPELVLYEKPRVTTLRTQVNVVLWRVEIITAGT